MKKLLIIILCILLVTGCKDCEEVNPTSKHYRLKEYQTITNNSVAKSVSYQYNSNNFLTDIFIDDEKFIHISKINDTLLEMNYYWFVNGNKINAILRVDVHGNRIQRVYEFNKVRNEIIDVKFEYQYIGDELQNSKSYAPSYFLEQIHQYNFEYLNENRVSMYMTYYYREPFSGFREFRLDTLYSEYTDIPFNKYIPFQNNIDNNLISMKGNQYGSAPFDPLYVLGINNYYCNLPNKHLVKNFEITSGSPPKYIPPFDYNYMVENGLVTKMNASDDKNYIKLIWE